MKSPVKIALVGLGHITHQKLTSLSLLNHFQVVAICDNDRAKADGIDLDVPFYHEYDELLETNVDSILIATPNDTHFKLSKSALAKGKNVLVEKPAVTKIEELLELKRLASENKTNLTIAYHASFAKELLWFISNHENIITNDLGPITGIQCMFYDPYMSGDGLRENAESLQGSWIDSGINALSVIDKLIDIEHVHIVDSRLTRLSAIPFTEIQGTVDFTFPIKNTGRVGRGQIDTNWTLNKNYKQTKLFFDGTDEMIILDHTKQQVLIKYRNQREEVIKDFSHQNERLVHHYLGVFNDYYDKLKYKRDNIKKSIHLHELLFTPYLQGE